MSGQPSRAARRQVFLNIPYSASYERIFVALTVALVALGRIPRLTFEVAEGGQGRLSRIFSLLKTCPVSIHDLSCVGRPARFNMPFELGLACAIREQTGRHDFLVLEKRDHRLDRTLSDLKAIDPKVHHGKPTEAISAVLDVLERAGGNPAVDEVHRLYRRVIRLVPALKKQHHCDSLFGSRIYQALVTLIRVLAEKRGLLS